MRCVNAWLLAGSFILIGAPVLYADQEGTLGGPAPPVPPAVVSRDALARAGWPEGAPGRNALDVHVLRLRRRLAPLGLAIRTVRSRGYLLEHANGSAARGRLTS